MSVLTVDGLCKRYPSFALDHMSFDLAEGKITVAVYAGLTFAAYRSAAKRFEALDL